MISISAMEKYIQQDFDTIRLVEMKPADLEFEERVRMSCFYCGKYGNNWKCPPNIPNLDYQKMVREFQYGVFVVNRMEFIEENYEEIRSSSSVTLHKSLLKMEQYMWNQNVTPVMSFIGGSCKLCRNGCGKEQCNNPYESRTPLEAIGVNVIKSAKKYGIEVNFPPKDFIMRIGALFW